MYQINNSNIEIEIIIGENKIVKLKDILPLYNTSENINKKRHPNGCLFLISQNKNSD